MKQDRLKSYFEQRVRSILLTPGSEPDGFWDYFARQEPSDEAILGLLAVSTAFDEHASLGSEYPSRFEALAALPEADRAAICGEFRRLLAAVTHC
jgi:hypothetical protein